MSWNSSQHLYRKLCQAIRDAYPQDRAQLFWARHKIKLELYKYHKDTPRQDIQSLHRIGLQMATFIREYISPDLEGIKAYNRAVRTLSLREAKLFRQDYLKKEEEHKIWCQQRISGILRQRPLPPYPF